MTRFIKNDHLIGLLVQDPLYQIRDDGSIWTFRSGNGTIKEKLRPIKFTKSNGYLGMRYSGAFILLHRIIYRKFIGELSNKLVINHKDGVRSNNSLNNLELVTDSENALHSHRELCRKKADFFGSNNPKSKLTNDQVLKIRKIYGEGLSTIAQLSKEYSVSKVTIRSVILKITYQNVA